MNMMMRKRKKQCLKRGACLVGTLLALFVVGVLFAVLEPPVENALHKWKMRRQFRHQFDTPGHYEPMPYPELAAMIGPGFTIGDAVERFGLPTRRPQHPYQSSTDFWRYKVIGPIGTAEERGLVTGFTLVFDHFILREWWPTEISGISIRYDRGELTTQGRDLSADEKWPGRRSSP